MPCFGLHGLATRSLRKAWPLRTGREGNMNESDDLAPARGIINGLLISVAAWVWLYVIYLALTRVWL